MEEKPMFVKISEYEDVKDVLRLINEKIHQAQKTFDKMKQIKQQEDADFNEWNQMLAEVNTKVATINEKLAQ